MTSLSLKIITCCLFALIKAQIPIIINTWDFQNATIAAWETLQSTGSAKDAIVSGCTKCEEEQCDFTVGFGGSPDENGETTLDALIFDGTAMDMGAVGDLRNVKNAIAVARDVLEHTEHSFLVGEQATEFAKSLEYTVESLETPYSKKVWQDWLANQCQPNFWKGVVPNPKTSCGPYKKDTDNDIQKSSFLKQKSNFNSQNHDTIGMIIVDRDGNVIAGTSTNGATHKIPGRVGDSPIAGAGAYADSTVGGAAATGDGDIMMRFLPSFVTVEEMRRGASPSDASKTALKRIVDKYSTFFGAVVAVTNKGEHGAACNGMKEFPYRVASTANGGAKTVKISC